MIKTREQRQKEAAAKEFARRARAGRAYYIVQASRRHASGREVCEIKFKKRSFLGLMYGSYSPENLYLTSGPIYEDRNHPDIRDLRTVRQQNNHEDEFADRFLSSESWRKELGNAASGTGFSVRDKDPDTGWSI